MKKKILIIYFIALISFTTASFVLARYLKNSQKDSLYVAENFYFSSDLLVEGGKTYKYQRGLNEIKVNISNNIDKLRHTEVDINYSVVIDKINGDGSSNKVNQIDGKLSGNAINSKEIVFNNLSSGTYRVRATTSKPYLRILEGTFFITESDNTINYEVNDNVDSTVVFLTVKTVDYNGRVKLKFPEGLYPDSNEEAFKDVNIENSREVIVQFNHDSSYTYTFYKENPKKVFNKEEFEVGGV